MKAVYCMEMQDGRRDPGLQEDHATMTTANNLEILNRLALALDMFIN